MVRQLKDPRDAKITLIETSLLRLKTDIKNMSENEVKK